ncbi:MAG: hypothetical protein CL872_06470 [Dehalococcoidaceae bacterium]|nr:hypothetical protein [Dehalococcoidaceae bacterium]|tara:strand:- start:324 stop:569 length:246 start_codon:yes stop_codon:yes gene_type:complete
MKTETINLVTIDIPKQINKIQELLNGEKIAFKYLFLTEHETIIKYIVPLAAQSGMQCSFSPPKDDIWEILVEKKDQKKIDE